MFYFTERFDLRYMGYNDFITSRKVTNSKNEINCNFHNSTNISAENSIFRCAQFAYFTTKLTELKNLLELIKSEWAQYLSNSIFDVLTFLLKNYTDAICNYNRIHSFNKKWKLNDELIGTWDHELLTYPVYFFLCRKFLLTYNVL